MELFLIYSDYLLAENILTSTRCKRDNYRHELQFYFIETSHIEMYTLIY